MHVVYLSVIYLSVTVLSTSRCTARWWASAIFAFIDVCLQAEMDLFHKWCHRYFGFEQAGAKVHQVVGHWGVVSEFCIFVT